MKCLRFDASWDQDDVVVSLQRRCITSDCMCSESLLWVRSIILSWIQSLQNKQTCRLPASLSQTGFLHPPPPALSPEQQSCFNALDSVQNCAFISHNQGSKSALLQCTRGSEMSIYLVYKSGHCSAEVRAETYQPERCRFCSRRVSKANVISRQDFLFDLSAMHSCTLIKLILSAHADSHCLPSVMLLDTETVADVSTVFTL